MLQNHLQIRKPCERGAGQHRQLIAGQIQVFETRIFDVNVTIHHKQ